MRVVALTLVSLCSVAVAQPDPFASPHPAPGATQVTPPPKPPSEASTANERPAETVTVEDPGKRQRSAALWTAAGGGVLLVSSAVVSLYAKSRYDSALDVPDRASLTPERVEAANDAIGIARYYGTGLFIAGSAAVGVAALLYIIAPERVRRETIVVPAVGHDQFGAALSGSF